MNIIQVGAEVKCFLRNCIQDAKTEIKKEIEQKSCILEKGEYKIKTLFTDKIQEIKKNIITHIYIIEAILIVILINNFIK